MTAFDLIWAEAVSDLEDVWGEEFTITGRSAPVVGTRSDVNARGTAHATHLAVTVTGMLVSTAQDTHPVSRGHASTDARGFGSEELLLDVAAADVGFLPERGYLVQQLATGRHFTIVDVREDVPGRYALPLTARA